jgi:hypothetical protein
MPSKKGVGIGEGKGFSPYMHWPKNEKALAPEARMAAQ